MDSGTYANGLHRRAAAHARNNPRNTTKTIETALAPSRARKNDREICTNRVLVHHMTHSESTTVYHYVLRFLFLLTLAVTFYNYPLSAFLLTSFAINKRWKFHIPIQNFYGLHYNIQSLINICLQLLIYTP